MPNLSPLALMAVSSGFSEWKNSEAAVRCKRFKSFTHKSPNVAGGAKAFEVASKFFHGINVEFTLYKQSSIIKVAID
ncbi:hypothetical protein GYH30_006431 [Glycine max]|nr:hypothetical protein GYH30_006431 [Glycine max]